VIRKRQIARKAVIKEITAAKYFKKEGFEPNYIITRTGRKISRVSFIATIVDTYKNDAGTYGAITFDDGTDTIRAKYFKDLTDMEAASKGEVVEVIGKVKEYGEEVYIITEHMFPRDASFELLRKVEHKQIISKWLPLVDKLREKIKSNASLEEILMEFNGKLTEEEIQGLSEFYSIESEFGVKKESETVESRALEEKVRGNASESKESEKVLSNEKLILKIVDEVDDGLGAEYSQIIQKADLSSEQVESTINNLLSDGTCYEPRPGKIKRL